MNKPNFVPLQFLYFEESEQVLRAKEFAIELSRRRTVRDFSDTPVKKEIIEQAIVAAGSAPSGANQQPWTFVAVSNTEIKKRIREAAEKEEQEFYAGRAPEEWRKALGLLGTNWQKPFLERAPYLIAIFAQSFGTDANGQRCKHYYVQESVGIATGFLIAALHHAGLATLTHTPSPMGFLNAILNRPTNERPFLLLVVGYPEKNAVVPNIQRKALKEISKFME